ncbi:BTAD domain-containing putative transcriptional regulator [Streptomyces erythrochromogenes]|uniref:AfsR/SARP family transcriptional regulator n=1 Tax=Streptomyces erythrochromogenes TaxID=285574 RepID=UPI003863DDC4|nr:AAA family ATPase [Streptomyces erythrochromogenes]
MRYLILGVTEAHDESGAALPVGGARLRALLAALALRAGRPVSVAELVDDVWGDAPPLDAPAALQALVARLRRALGGRGTVPAAPTGGYLLAASRDDVDLHRFTRLAADGDRELAADPESAARTLRTALSLWRGPALADLAEPARTAHAAAPEARRAATLRRRIEADLLSGTTAPALLLPEIEALVHECPYDEPLRAQQLRALRAAGRPADALAAYERTRRALADGLGTDPGPELTALHAELLRRPPQPPPHPHPAPPQPSSQPPSYPHPAPPAATPQTAATPHPAPPQPGPQAASYPHPAPPAATPQIPVAPLDPASPQAASYPLTGTPPPGPQTAAYPLTATAPASTPGPSHPQPAPPPATPLGPQAGTASPQTAPPAALPPPPPSHPLLATPPATPQIPATPQAASYPLTGMPPRGPQAGTASPQAATPAGLPQPPSHPLLATPPATPQTPVAPLDPAFPQTATAPATPLGSQAGTASPQPPSYPLTVPPPATPLAPQTAPHPLSPQPGTPSPQAAPATPQAAPATPQAAVHPSARPEAPRGNLRPRLNSFVGREPELAALHGDLARLRLVTLTGPGGSGKTRLAEHAAAAHPEPGWLVELARLDHPAAVPGAVLSALGLRENSLVAREAPAPTAAADPTTRLIEHCAHRSLLLVLDNCEHVVEAAAELAERLLTHCPGLRVLATSREPLGVPGETVRPVEPLPPDPAHRLFADRGAAARAGFTVDEDPAAVAEICARLDGLPLAIELAAARLRLLTPRQIADRLDDRFRLLTSGARTVLPRQQTLRAVVDWSWDLLDEAERTVLRRLSVFAGGCDLPAAEAVCGDGDGGGPGTGPDVADTLGSLVDKSLVLAEPYEGHGSPGMRYRMLETIHEYAAERATAHPADARATARRHVAHYLAFAEQAEPLIRSAAQLPWIRLVETELDNLRAALHTTTVEEVDVESAQRLAFALGWFWWLRNYRGEGAEWTTRILALTPAQPPEGTPAYWRRMRLQVFDMFLLAESNSAEKFRTPEYRDLAVHIKTAFRHGSPETAVFPGILWPATSFLTGDVLEFHADLDQAVENCRHHAGEWELGVVLMLRTHVAIDVTGGLPTVDADLAELHAIAQRVGDRWTRAQVASAAGEIALSRGRYAEARTEFEECLRLAREVGAHVEAPFAIARIAEAAYSAGDLDDAERLLAEADDEADQHGGVYDVSAYARLLAALLACQRGDTARARAECELARVQSERITVPAQLTAGLDAIDAVITAREQGPEAALALIGPALSAAVEGRCAERVLAGVAEAAARFLADADRPAEAVRAFAAATAWRAGLPRSVPEAEVVDGLPERTRALLGHERWAREKAAGAALTPAELVTALTGS